jgi:hypothetical protein
MNWCRTPIFPAAVSYKILLSNSACEPNPDLIFEKVEKLDASRNAGGVL